MLLTDEEIMGVVLDEGLGVVADENTRAIAKAQLKKVVEELKGIIESRGEFDHQDSAYSNAKDKRWHFSLYIAQDDWDIIWQDLLKEVEG